MLPKRPITAVLGLLLVLTSLVGYKPGRVSLIVFGHACVITGCFLVTWGIYLLPYCKPKLAHVFGRPLFWGLFSILGGICALYHGFCRCFSAGRSNERAEQT
ncbi:MAG: hypothetical protein ACYS6K_22335 [Planctomycetota bacterium]|jgi:hypothetical protein